MRLTREPGWWILAAAVLLFFWRPLTSETFCYRDLHLLFYPKKVFLVEALASGQIPLWDPFAHGGLPYLGNPSNMFFYPANVLYAILPVLQAFNTMIALQIVFCAWGAYSLARTLALSPSAAFASGAVYGLCGYSLSTANLVPLVAALPWVPIALGAVHRFVMERRPRDFVVAAVAAALPLLAGAAELTGMMFATIAVWLVFVPRDVSARSRATAFALVLLLAAGLAMALLVPAAEMIAQSSRAAPQGYEEFSRWSMSPRRLPELVVPRFFGPTDVPDDAAYWGAKFEWKFPYILSVYAGIVTVLLAIVGAMATGRRHPQRSIVLVLAALAVIGIVVSLGLHLPFFRTLYDHAPGVRNFRYPIKAMLLSLTPLAILAGIGVQRIDDGQTRVASIISGVSATLLVLVSALFSLSPWFRAGFTGVMFGGPLAEASHRELQSGLTHTATFAVLFALAAVLASYRGTRIARFVAALLLVDLAVAGSRVNFYAPRSLFAKPPIAEAARKIAGEGRLFRDPVKVSNYRLPEQDPAWVIWWEIQTLRSYTGSLYGLPVILHNDYDGLAPSYVKALTTRTEQTPWPERLPVLMRSAVRAVISRSELPRPFVKTFTTKDSDGQPLHLYENPGARRIRFATRPHYVANDGAALEAVLRAPFRAEEVILVGRGNSTQGGAGCTPRIAQRSKSLHESVVEVESSCSGFLVFADTFYPGWQAFVDGRRQELVRADYAYSAVAVDAGRHVVRKVYRPLTVPTGLAGSALSAVALAVLALRMKRRNE